MKFIKTGRLLLVLATTVFVSGLLSSQQQVNHQSTKIKFTSPDGVFRFEYPDSLVTCKKDAQQSGRWKPEESCEAYIPVCSDVHGDSAGTRMCVAYPASKMRGTNFQAAAFSVNRLQQANTEAECLRVAEPPPHWKPSHAENINGVKFNVTHTDGVATGNLIDGYLYRAFHRNNCYELDIRISFSNPANFDPGTVKEFDQDLVQHDLKAVLETFEFTK
jgi:hypothetical protein